MTIQEIIDNVKLMDYQIENGEANINTVILRNYYLDIIKTEMEG